MGMSLIAHGSSVCTASTCPGAIWARVARICLIVRPSHGIEISRVRSGTGAGPDAGLDSGTDSGALAEGVLDRSIRGLLRIVARRRRIIVRCYFGIGLKSL